MSMTLYGYWRSTAAYRVRIALGLKALPHDAISISLRTGEQSADAYKAINPQGFVPFLVDGNTMLGQSLAIIEYLDEVYRIRCWVPANRPRGRGFAALPQSWPWVKHERGWCGKGG